MWRTNYISTDDHRVSFHQTLTTQYLLLFSQFMDTLKIKLRFAIFRIIKILQNCDIIFPQVP